MAPNHTILKICLKSREASVGPWLTLSLCPAAGFQPLLLEPLLRFHHTLRNLGLEEEEYVLMQAMSLFSPGRTRSAPLVSDGPQGWFVSTPLQSVCFKLSDRSGVQEHGVIDRIHENMALTLKTRIDSKRTGPEKR